jgi:hypothetical protein
MLRPVQSAHILPQSMQREFRRLMPRLGRRHHNGSGPNFGRGRKGISGTKSFRRGRRRWAILLRRGAMTPEPATRWSPRTRDHLRFSATPHGRRFSDVAIVWMLLDRQRAEPSPGIGPHRKQRSCSVFRARTGRTLAKGEISISRWRHSASLQEVPVEVGQIEITHLVTNT